MKIKLSITITIKDYLPKDSHIPYKNFICLFNSNNFNSKIKLSDLSNKNSIKHKVECIDSNIIYDLHMLDSIKNTLIGIYQLTINYDQIKNLNINDILTHEERAKLLIDLKTKRKIFGKITNVGDIFLILSTEIKILDKKMYISEGRESNNRPKNVNNKNNIDIIRDYNLTPREIKKLQMIKLLKIDREALKATDNYSNNNENKLIDDILDENNISTIQKDNLRRYKTLNISKMTKIINQNKIKYQNFNNSCSKIMRPKCNSTINNFQSKIEGNKKMSRIKKALSKTKVSALNLMEPKAEYLLSTQTERNTLELRTLSRGFKTTFVNFKKIPMRHIKKNSFTSLKSEHLSSKGKRRKNISSRIKYKLIDGSDNFQRNNHKNKIFVNTSKTSLTRKTVYETKNKINNNKLELYYLKRINTEQQRSVSRKSEKINNIFLQSGKKLSYIKKKPILTDNELKRLITDKDILFKENYHNNYMSNIKRLTLSPKISIKFPKSLYISNDTNSYRYIRQRKKKEILTPRTTQIKKTSYPNNTNNVFAENEDLKKKCFNLIELHYLLTGKLKNVCRNNMNNFKKLEIIKEKNNNLNKNKNKLEEIRNNDESKRIKSHGFSHYKEEQLYNKILDI